MTTQTPTTKDGGNTDRPPAGMSNPARRILKSPIHNDFATLEKYSRETNGEYSLFMGGVKPGGGNPYVLSFSLSPSPLHTSTSRTLIMYVLLYVNFHRYHFHTLFTLTFTTLPHSPTPLSLEIAGEIKTLQPGDPPLAIPKGVAHRFFLPLEAKENAEFSVEVRPGNEAYEQFLTVMFGLANDGLCKGVEEGGDGSPRDVGHLAVALGLGDVWLPGGEFCCFC